MDIEQEDVERAGDCILAALRENGRFVYSKLLDDPYEAPRLEASLKINDGKVIGAFSAALHHLISADICEVFEDPEGEIVAVKLAEEIPDWFEFMEARNHTPLTRS